MDDRLDHILSLAFRVVPAAEANEAIAAARSNAGTAAGRGHIIDADNEITDPGAGADAAEEPAMRAYELVLPAGATFDSFVADQLPKLVYHLESLGAHLPQARGVLLCVFSGERLFFLEAAETISEVCKLLGASPAELVERYGTGELRTAVQRPVLALPGPKREN